MPSVNEKQIAVFVRWINEASTKVDSNVSMRLWNGEVLPLGKNVTSKIIIAINSPDVVRRLIFAPKLKTIVQLYGEELLDIEGGTIIDAARNWDHIQFLKFAKTLSKPKLIKSLWPFVRKSSVQVLNDDGSYQNKVADKLEDGRDDKDFIKHHYDVSNDFYAQFLDPEMVYSCGYFATPETSLEDAQIAKLDHICRKLRLEKGDRLLDIGSGWGGLACHAAQNYGAVVHGATLSEEQFKFAIEKVKRLGLEDKVTIELRDYRSIEPKGQYDKISQVEMFEHIGIDNYDLHFQRMHDLLRTRGLYFHQASTRMATKKLEDFRNYSAYMKFVTEYIFPGGELDYIGMTVTNLERFRLEVHDVEGMREHFLLTLEHWVNRLWENREKASQIAGRNKTRLWLFYMSLMAISFERNTLGLFQVVASKRRTGLSGLPNTREDLYNHG